MLVAGRLGDLVGRRCVFLFGVALFTLASAACGFADSQGLLIAARFVQGIGGAIAFSVTIALIVSEFPDPADRAKAMSAYMFVAVGGGSVGLLLGGLITAVRRLALDLLHQHPDRRRDAPARSRVHRRARVDRARRRGRLARRAADHRLADDRRLRDRRHGRPRLGLGAHARLRGASLALQVAFLALEARIANPILPLQIFRVRGLAVAAAVRAFVFTGMFAVFFFGALYMRADPRPQPA